jgi:hypothetical protein
MAVKQMRGDMRLFGAVKTGDLKTSGSWGTETNVVLKRVQRVSCSSVPELEVEIGIVVEVITSEELACKKIDLPKGLIVYLIYLKAM